MTAFVSSPVEPERNRYFSGRWLDFFLIGSLWSILLGIIVAIKPASVAGMDINTLVILVFAINSTHFAASTVRLYTTPGAAISLPFVSCVLPVLMLVIASICIGFPEFLGRNWQALYLTWSPYHYAAQVFGICVIYCGRFGLELSGFDKRLLWAAAMLPFIRSFIGTPDAGLGWFVERADILAVPLLGDALQGITELFLVLIFVVPVLLAIRFWRRPGPRLPMIVLAVMISNGLWWTVFDYTNAFVISAIAHGLQYLAIVITYYVRDRRRSETTPRAPLYYVVNFYLRCLLLGYLLFYCLPHAFEWFGAGLGESMLIVIATINIHHFIVDRYIWRRKSRGDNRSFGSSRHGENAKPKGSAPRI